ncbi:MAG: hypothetical protein V3V95_04495 [Thermodesulfobacteriota bacterium]
MLRSSLIVSILLFTLALSSCGGPKKPKPTLYLQPMNIKAAGYTLLNNSTFIFDEKSARLTLTLLRAPEDYDVALIKTLISRGYHVISMEIVNKTIDEKMIYNPSMSTLMSNRLGLRKPLDYTSLYQVAMGKGMERTLNRELKGAFYDSNEIIRAGKTKKKLLIFMPFKDRATKAKLTIQELYIGADTISLAFPFKLIEEGSEPN